MPSLCRCHTVCRPGWLTNYMTPFVCPRVKQSNPCTQAVLLSGAEGECLSCRAAPACPAGHSWSASSPCSMQPSLLAFWGGFHSWFQSVASACFRLHQCTVSGWGAGLGASLSPWGTSCRDPQMSHTICPLRHVGQGANTPEAQLTGHSKLIRTKKQTSAS